MEDFFYVDVKKVNYHSSFVFLESGMVDYKNCIGHDIITKRDQNGMVDYKNRKGQNDSITVIPKWNGKSYKNLINHDDIITKSMVNEIIYYVF